MPSVTSWSRIEPAPPGNDVAAGLAARTADALWLLARQWQVGEFQAEDGGTPDAQCQNSSVTQPRLQVSRCARRCSPEHAMAEREGRETGRDRSPQAVWSWPTSSLVRALCGGLALGVGALVYWTDRDPNKASLIPAVAMLAGLHLFGTLGGWLPSFVHPLAFSLFSAALMATRARSEYGACAFWFALNAAFEIGQHPQVRRPLADALRHGFGEGPVARAFENYFQRGTFDLGDLVAAALGAALAAAVLHSLRVHQENRHAPQR